MSKAVKILFAVKLYLTQLWEAEFTVAGKTVDFQLLGFSFQRVWVQGQVSYKDAKRIMIQQGGANIVIKSTGAIGAVWDQVEMSSWIMVIGRLQMKEDLRHIAGHKVVVMDSPGQQERWEEELRELHAVVYPHMLQEYHS